MKFHNIPLELRELPQWVVWRSVNRGQGATKIPYNAWDPKKRADPTDPGTWAEYEIALKAVQSDPNLGLGFVFTKNDPFIGWDFDAIEKVSEEGRNREIRQQIEADLLAVGSYREYSPSGAGLHIIARGTMPEFVDARVVRSLQIELYANGRFFTMTGNTPGAPLPILDMQQGVNDFLTAFPKSDMSRYEEIELLETTANGRRLDLPDADIVAFLINNMTGFHDRYHGINITDWSRSHRDLIGDVDKVTGDPEQVKRIVFNSPLVIDGGFKNGETRVAKSERIFSAQLAEVRAVYENKQASYQSNPLFIAHGKQIAANILAHFEALREAERLRKLEVMEALRKAEEEGSISKYGAGMLQSFEQLIGIENLVLTRPPGTLGQFVEANENGSYHPYTKYAIPSTLAVLSGIMGRRYKIDRSGLNINFLLAAESGTGKTDHGKSWEEFISQANARLRQSRILPPPQRILKGSAASVQGIGDRLQSCPSVAWFVDEAYQMVRNMTDEKSPTGTQLRNSFNEMYDSSSVNAVFELPASRASQKAAADGIPNLNVSSYWTMTPEEFNNFTGSVSNGFMSRMLIIRETETYGQRQKRPQIKLPLHLQPVLDSILTYANKLDDIYAENSEQATINSQIQPIFMDEEADQLFEAVADLIDTIKRKAIKGDLPKDYMMVNRIPVNAKKIAGLIAAVDNPFNPVIRADHLKWAVGYIVQNIVTFLSDVDKGELGQGAGDDVLAAIRYFKQLARKHKNGVPKKVFHDTIKRKNPFSKSERPTPSAMASNTIEHMLKEEILEQIEDTKPGPGRKAILLTPGDHPAWSQS